MKTFRSWEVTSWPEVLWKVPASRSRWPIFHHMGTDVRADSDEYGRTTGDTLWAARIDENQIVGLAWEWIEVQPGVPAIRDPNGFVSNAKLLGKHGADLEELQSVVRLNRIAHGTRWQRVVSRVVRDAVGPVDSPTAWPPLSATRLRADPNELAQLRELVANLPFQAALQPRLAAA